MRITSLDQGLDALFDFTGPRVQGRSSLEMMRQAMDLLGNPHERLRAVHITGTSGKTSTSYYVRALLQDCGFRTGLTVSPHIQHVNERVQIDGLPLEETAFCSYTSQMLTRLEPLRSQCTYFELVMSLALWIFACEKVDYAVVEVGIGGTRDASNILSRPDKLALIGPIGLDHTEKLGTTIPEIAVQKAGILVPGGAGLIIEQSAEAMDVVQAHAREISAHLEIVDSGAVTGTFRPSYQRGNWALALAGVSYLAQRDGFSLPENLEPLTHVTPPARYEWFEKDGHRVLLDGAHNPQKMAGLVQAVREQGVGPFPTLATFSSAPPDKIIATMAALAPIVSTLIVPEFVLGHDGKTKVSAPATEVAAAARSHGIETRIIPDLTEALDTLLADPSADLLVTGSLYMAALVRPRLIG